MYLASDVVGNHPDTSPSTSPRVLVNVLLICSIHYCLYVTTKYSISGREEWAFKWAFPLHYPCMLIYSLAHINFFLSSEMSLQIVVFLLCGLQQGAQGQEFALLLHQQQFPLQQMFFFFGIQSLLSTVYTTRHRGTTRTLLGDTGEGGQQIVRLNGSK